MNILHSGLLCSSEWCAFVRLSSLLHFPFEFVCKLFERKKLGLRWGLISSACRPHGRCRHGLSCPTHSLHSPSQRPNENKRKYAEQEEKKTVKINTLEADRWSTGYSNFIASHILLHCDTPNVEKNRMKNENQNGNSSPHMMCALYAKNSSIFSLSGRLNRTWRVVDLAHRAPPCVISYVICIIIVIIIDNKFVLFILNLAIHKVTHSPLATATVLANEWCWLFTSVVHEQREDYFMFPLLPWSSTIFVSWSFCCRSPERLFLFCSPFRERTNSKQPQKKQMQRRKSFFS